MGTHPLRLAIIGVDGASHRWVTEWCAQGKLPTFSRLRSAHPDRPLLTPFPPHTAPGWSSMFTGVGPGEHGIYQFWQLQARQYRPALITVADFAREPLWRILERRDLSVGLYHIPMTHPPEPIRGFMVTWPLTPTLGYAYPKHIIAELLRQGLHYKSDLVTMYREDANYFEAAREQIASKTETLLYLLKAHPVDVLIAVYTELDRVSHYYWGVEEEPGPEVLAIYEAVDEALGQLLDGLDDEVPVLIVSDHGFGVCRSNFNVNVVLEQAGLLASRARFPGPMARAPASGFFADADAALSATWFNSTDGARSVDWCTTRAYMPAPGCFGININRRGRQVNGIVADGADYDTVARDITDIIGAIRVDGEPVFDVVPRDEVYHGHRVEEAPDFLLIPRRWDIMPAPALASEQWSSPTQAGVHRKDGILFARNVHLDASEGPYRVEDILPTCLAHLGLPLPDGLDGRNLDVRSAPIATEPARRFAPSGAHVGHLADQVRIEQRLAQLGYL